MTFTLSFMANINSAKYSCGMKVASHGKYIHYERICMCNNYMLQFPLLLPMYMYKQRHRCGNSRDIKLPSKALPY